MSDMAIDRTINEMLHYYHKSVVRHPGGLKFEYIGRTIKPMTPAIAAESAGMSVTDFSKRIDPQQKEQPFLKSWAQNLMDGMDTSSLEVLDRHLGRVCFTKPASLSDDDLPMAALKLGEEMGCVFNEISNAKHPDSEGGVLLSHRERIRIAQTLHTLMQRTASVLVALKDEK